MDSLPSFFFFIETATTEIYTLSLHDALPIFDQRRALLLHAERAAGEDDAPGAEGFHLLEGHRAGVDLAVDVQLPHAPGDELRVLRPEVEDEDLLCVNVGHRGGAV